MTTTSEGGMRRIMDWSNEWIDPSLVQHGGVPTEHLPDEVVNHPFLLGIDCRQDESNPRVGGCWITINFDGRLNPSDLSDQEKEYIVTMIKWALDGLPQPVSEGVEDDNSSS